MASALAFAFLSVSAAPASAKGVTPFYDAGIEPRGSFFCGGPPTAWSKFPLVGTIGRVVAGKGYIAGVYVRKVPQSAMKKGANVRFGVRVDGVVRLPEQEFSISDISRESFKATRGFRVAVLEKKAVLTGSGSRFGTDGGIQFRSLVPGNLYSQSEIAAGHSIKVICATPEDFQDGSTQGQLSSDIEILIRLIGARSRSRIFRPN
jgi:hypothetical protein